MAAKPGPAIALAALAALFLLKKKGGGGGGAVDKEKLDGTEEGEVVEDDTPNNPASPSSGGKKVPKGTGAGGGSWDPGKLGPTALWISPDCRNVVTGTEYYEKVLVPAMLKVFDDFHSSQEAYLASLPENQGKQPDEYGGRSTSDLYTVLAVALGFWKVKKTPVVNEASRGWFGDTEFANKPPGSCVLAAPMFHVGLKEAGKLYQAGVNGIVPASQAAFNEALSEYFGEYPQMAMWLYQVQEQMVQDERFPAGSRDISSLFDLSFVSHSSTGTAGNPPVKAPRLKVSELFSIGALANWYNQAVAYVQKWAIQYPKAVSEYSTFVSDWWDQATAAGTKLPVSPSLTHEQAAKVESPATVGVVIGRIMTAAPGGPEIPMPIAGAVVDIDGSNYSTDNQGYFEATVPAGWHPVGISVGPKEYNTYVTVEAGQTALVDFVAPRD